MEWYFRCQMKHNGTIISAYDRISSNGDGSSSSSSSNKDGIVAETVPLIVVVLNRFVLPSKLN